MSKTPNLKTANDGQEETVDPIPTPEEKFDLNQFRSTRASTIAGVETLLPPLPHHSISAARDFVRLHPDENRYWSIPLCVVDVPIKGQKSNTLHLIQEKLAAQNLPSAQIRHVRFALATKPNNGFFLYEVPAQNLLNVWNATNLQACEQAKTHWTRANSRREEGTEGYQTSHAKDPDAFPEPEWPSQTLDELIATTFKGRLITDEANPAFKRLIGEKQAP